MTEATARRESFLTGLDGRLRELAASGPDWLKARRRAARERFDEVGLPHARLEEWKNTSVELLAAIRFEAPPESAAGTLALPEAFRALGDVPRLVFADGRLVPGLSRTDRLPSGVWAGSLAGALAARPDDVERAVTRVPAAELGPFHALHDASFEDAAVVVVDDGVDVGTPIAVLHVARGGRAVACHPTTVVALGRSSRATLVEGFAASGPGPYLVNAATDVELGDDSRLTHLRLQLEDEGAFHVSRVASRQGRDTHYHALALDLGARLARHDVLGVVDGEGAVCKLDGLVLTGGVQHVDNHTVLDHARPHGDSRELYKCVLGDRSRSVFHGRIVVRPGAQKTDAKQSNPNLLLSPAALAHTRPQLEIYADDVKCTHGATIGRLDDEAVFYLRSRGVGDADARNLLVSAFAGEILDRIDLPGLHAWAEDEIGRRLAGARR